MYINFDLKSTSKISEVKLQIRVKHTKHAYAIKRFAWFYRSQLEFVPIIHVGYLLVCKHDNRPHLV